MKDGMPSGIQTAQPLELRHYQLAAVDAIWNGLADHAGNHLAVLPTGTGKALVICEFVRRALIQYPGSRILVLTHSKELVEQNFLEMLGLWPECPAGIHSAGLKSRDVHSPVIFGSIQSIHKKAFKLQKVDVVIVDEAQTIPRNAKTMWLTFFADLQTINPHLRIVGLTATAYRLDSGMLHKGEGAMFSRIVYEYGIVDAIKEGYLTQPVSRSSSTQIDTTGVGTRGGEFIPHDLEAVALDPSTVEAIAEEFCRAGANRRGWIMFGVGVKHCTMLRDAIRRRGFSCEGVFAITPAEERDRFIAEFKAQKIRCLVSVNALAVGFNAKHVDLIGLARPTKSTGFYIQACGRGTRLFPDKDTCLILDWGGNIARHGFIDKPNVKTPGKGDGSIPLKVCTNCNAENYIAATVCKECGWPFPVEGSKLAVKAASAPLLSTQMALPEWLPVEQIKYSRHEKAGKPPSMKVTYRSGLNFYSEWVCFEHTGGAKTRAERWWTRRQRSVGSVPRTVDEALQRTGTLLNTTEIQVRQAGQYTEVVYSKVEI